jgi:hypothetical protein
MVSPTIYVLAGLVAAVLVTTTPALAGSGVGGAFNLGQTNIADQKSTLSSATPDAGLVAQNTGTGTALYSRAVTGICAGALLFEGTHEMGTRADALEIADAIRASTAGRLARVKALSVPGELQLSSSRWISLQRRLAELYARLWVRIYDTIEAARTPAQQAALPKRVGKLVHAPDRLKLAAGRLELKLHVPDCTGGG